MFLETGHPTIFSVCRGQLITVEACMTKWCKCRAIGILPILVAVAVLICKGSQMFQGTIFTRAFRK